MTCKNCNIKSGATLAAALNRRIDAMENDDRSRGDIIEAMGRAAGISAGTVNQILNGDINCPPINRLEGFAEVLDVSVATLTRAAEGDGCNYDEDSDNSRARATSIRGRSWYKIRNMEGAAIQVSIHDEIGAWGVSAADFIADLKSHQSAVSINLSIHSPGGSVLDGLAMYNALKAHPGKIHGHVEGIAASAASFVLMASDSISMPEDAFIMIHNAHGGAMGDAADLRDMADVIDKLQNAIINIYERRTGLDREALAEMMKVETWMTAAEALEHGFTDNITAAVDVAAKVGVFDKYFKSLPVQTSNDVRGIKTVRDFENFLRDAGGISKRLAEALTSRAKVVLRGDPEDPDDTLADISEALNKVKIPTQINA